MPIGIKFAICTYFWRAIKLQINAVAKQQLKRSVKFRLSVSERSARKCFQLTPCLNDNLESAQDGAWQ